ncbi:hypothetical protein HHI36_013717 [Cryptolaemus montrouzieri]|uniref:Uncharacterized protein n=1 Tax=Cryptolaemus montrouzieri TaxID=559131 RepID=A0ABD2NIM4_9CUCU
MCDMLLQYHLSGRIDRNSYGRRNYNYQEYNDLEFIDISDEYTDENIDEDIEEQHYGNRDKILNEKVTIREENIVEECVEHINKETNANIDVNIDEQHFGNQRIILNECTTGIFDTVEDSNSSQDEKVDETMLTKYNKKNNQKFRLLGKKYEGMKNIINDNEGKIIKKNAQKEEKGVREKTCTHGAEKKTDRSFYVRLLTTI